MKATLNIYGNIAGLFMTLFFLSACVQPHPDTIPVSVTPPGKLPSEPILRIENTLHTAAISSLSMDSRRRFALTTSRDTTARLWDVQTGRFFQVFRVPSGYGRIGALESGAISPDGKIIAVGGWTGPENGQKSIYIFDRQTGKLRKRLKNIPAVIYGLAFSPNGRFLAAVTGKGGGLYVWDSATWLRIAHDHEYGEETHGLAFAPDGRLVTASYDGFVRLYNKGFHLVTMRGTAGGLEPGNVRFSPDGKFVAVGFNDSTKINILSGSDLNYLYTPDTGPIGKGSLAAVGWSKNGRQLFVGGRREKSEQWRLLQWQGRGKKACHRITIPLSGNVVAVDAVGRGRLLVASRDPALGLVDRHGKLSWLHRSVSADFIGRPNGLHLSGDGSAILLTTNSSFGKKSFTFALTDKGAILKAGSSSVHGLHQPLTRREELVIADWQFRNYRHYEVPTVNGKPLALEKFESSMSVALQPTGNGFVLGTDRYLRAYDSQGALRWRQPVQSAWSVNIAANTVVAALRDGTVRWYRLDNGREIMALFIGNNEREWVVWTPGGFFDHSPGGEKLVGFQLNRSWDNAPDFISIEQMYNSLYRPDIFVSGFLGNDQQYVAATRKVNLNKMIKKGMPPRVTLTLKTKRTKAETVRVGVRIEPGTGGIGRVVYRVNGVTRLEDTAGIETKKLDLEKTLPLEPGKNSIEVTAYNRSNEIESKPARATIFRQTIRTKKHKPSLFVLAIGVSKYRDHTLKLRYPVDDARAFTETLRRHGKKLFADITVEPLFDDEVTKEKIQQAFDRLQGQMHPDDVFVLYVAGHGLAVDGNYYFVPWNLIYKNEQSVVKQGISRQDLLRFLSTVTANKSVILLDTCNAGAFSGVVSRGLGEKAAISKLVRATGRAVIMASTDKQAAYEGYKGHGVFTWTLIEALQGRADKTGNRDGIISINELAEFVMEEVPKITMKKWKYEQFPLQDLTGRSFPLGVARE